MTAAFPLADGVHRLPLVTAVLLAVAFPPFHPLVPSFVALAPLALWLSELPHGRRGARRAVRGAFSAGILFHALLLHWMLTALVPRTPLAVPAYLFAVLLLSGLWAAMAAGVHGARGLGWPVWLALPVFWTAMEWGRAHLGDLAFPWLQLGDSLTGWPRLIGAADLVGARGLSFWLALVSGLLAAALRDLRAGGSLRWRPGIAALLVVLAPVAYSLHRWETLETRPVARVTVLQPNLSPGVKAHPRRAVARTVEWVEGLADAGRTGPFPVPGPAPDAVVLPETAFPVVPDSVASGVGTPPGSLRDWIGRLGRRLGAPVLYGALDAGGRTGERRHNAVFYHAASGEQGRRYAKRRLVPGFERVPFLDAAWLRRRLPDAVGTDVGGFSPGRRAPLFRAGEGRFGVLVCYESIFGELARSYRRRGADFLVNVTNDGWFGRREPAWRRTAALWQHPAHLVMRAVENRMGVVRAANTGISGILDPRGRWTRRTELFEPAALTGEVRAAPGPTPFSRLGDLAGGLSALAAAGVALACAARWRTAVRRRGRTTGIFGTRSREQR